MTKNAANLDVVVVNLERSADRRRRMEAMLAARGIGFSFFNAIDGQAGHHPLFAKADQRLAEIRRGFRLNDGELGCFASHYLLWQQCVEQGRPLLIFEDDVVLNDNFLQAYELAARHIGRLGMIRFSGHKRRECTVLEKVGEDHKILRFFKGPHGTSCYAVSPAAAKRLLRTAEVWFEPVDLHLDRFWTHGVASLAVHPYPVGHSSGRADLSEIWQGRQREPKSRRYRWLRALYRARDDILRFASNLPFMFRKTLSPPVEPHSGMGD